MERYDRQMRLPQWGAEGQARLRRARVLVVGVGGLGSPIALYLAGAGVGTLGLVDADTVSLSNLQRQVLYTESEVGQPKVECAARRLQALNSEVKVEPHNCRLTADNAADIIRHYDVVVDACDNFGTRYLLNDTCAALQKPYVYGAISGYEGQVAVFIPGGKSYRNLYPDEHIPQPDNAVVGVTPAIVGSVQANETLKLLVGYGEPLVGKLWTIDLRTMQSYLLSL
ncbi:MAG: HesA/MoeB/ThiF family protein [Bacteroides sp.]